MRPSDCITFTGFGIIVGTALDTVFGNSYFIPIAGIFVILFGVLLDKLGV